MIPVVGTRADTTLCLLNLNRQSSPRRRQLRRQSDARKYVTLRTHMNTLDGSRSNPKPGLDLLLLRFSIKKYVHTQRHGRLSSLEFYL